MIWTARQRTVLAVIVLAAVAWMGWRYAGNRSYIADPLPTSFPAGAELADRIDPNTADWQALSAIPGLGVKRAQEIVTERERFLASHRGKVAYRELGDLERVKGIGPATLTLLQPYLVFPQQDGPATQASR